MSCNSFHVVVSVVILGLVVESTYAQAHAMRVVDLPTPRGAKDISFMKRRGDVRFQVASDFKSVGAFYGKTLAETGWTKSGRDNLQRNFWVQTFSQGKAKLEVRVDSRPGGSEVRLTPQGMMWQEDDQPTPKDLPLPADATELEYDDFFESVEFKSPSGVRDVAAFLSTELAQRKWTKAANEFDFDHLVRMKFAFDKSTLVIDVRAADTGSEVAIRTKGMQWDGMKAEIARAKQQAEQAELAEQVAAEVEREAEREAEVANVAASLPKRKDKPKQGIEKLPKLPSEGRVVMDGKTFQLSHVIAYEFLEHGEWSTKIVATQKAIKQETLLARLKKTGTDRDEDDNPPSWPEPYLELLLDEDDRPDRLSLRAGGTPGSASGDELDGAALVEDRRARGTVRLQEPGSFFDKVYTAELSFDTPVLTRDSTVEKQLTNAPQLATFGKLTIGGRTYQLANVVGYEMKQFDEPMTAIVLSEKPLSLAKLKAALGRQAIDDYFEFTPQVKLLIDAEDNVSSVSIWADNMSLGGNSGLDDTIVIEDGRARGTARMTEPSEFLDNQYTFEVSFDVQVLQKRRSTVSRPRDGLLADSYDGIPIPEGHDGIQSQGSPFRTEANATVRGSLQAVVDFYRRELTSGEWGEWKESVADAKVEPQTAKIAFRGPTGSLTVLLKANGQQTAITLVTRDAQAAKAAGLFPTPGKARLYIANDSDRTAVFTINQREYKIPAGAGAEDPKTGFNWEVAAGNYTVETRPPGDRVQTEKLKISPNETWAVIIDGTGGFYADQLY